MHELAAVMMGGAGIDYGDLWYIQDSQLHRASCYGQQRSSEGRLFSEKSKCYDAPCSPISV